jgi:NMD protein affecting ribosome stability and mRNA decay
VLHIILTAESAMNPRFIDNNEKASGIDFFISDAKDAEMP